jgi:autotransporter-associated beta strand protein
LKLDGANLHTGLTVINAGTLKYGINNALASGAVTVSGGTLDIVTFNDTVGAVTLTSGTITGTTGVLTATSYAVQSGTISAIISGAAVMTKTTAGTVTLTRANTYTGVTNVNAGILKIQDAAALGTTAGGTTVANGAQLQLDGGVAVGAEALTLSGAGIANDGALRNIGGNNSWAGAITLGSAVRLNSDAGTLALGGTINGAFDLTLDGSAGGTIDLNGIIGGTTRPVNLTTGGTINLGAALNLAEMLTHNSGTWTSGANAIDVNGNFNLVGGTFNAPSTTLNVAGNWSTPGTGFVHNSGAVILDGSDQSITGNMTFYGLTKIVVSAATLTFGAGSIQTVTNALTLQGAAGQLLSLRSSASGTQWKIDPQGTRTVSYVDVKDSNNINAAVLIPTNSVDSGNNTNWFTAPPAPQPTPAPTPVLEGALAGESILYRPLPTGPMSFFTGVPVFMPGGAMVVPEALFPVPVLYMEGGRLFLGYGVRSETIAAENSAARLQQPLLSAVRDFGAVTGEASLPKPTSFWDVIRFVIFGRSWESEGKSSAMLPRGQAEHPSVRADFHGATGGKMFPKTTSIWDVLRFVIFGRSFDPETEKKAR